jgi:hypothetical protein
MKLFKTITTWFAAALLAACATPNPSGVAAAQTPAEIAAQVCPPLQTTLAGLNALVGLPIDAKVDLATVTPIVAAVCAAGTTVNFASLQTLQKSALPALVNALQASGMAVEQQNALVLDLTVAQLILTAAEQAQAEQEHQPSVAK